ncbi:MAG: class IV adenylate cyclase [Hymenobacteraceae bacterium]|nr:class IV adenylate cyclase [Hymenobacteraceae bacterium]
MPLRAGACRFYTLYLYELYADITIKARCADPTAAEHILLQHKADYKGTDVQTDTFYESDYGRLKHRRGNIENVLMHYNRQHCGSAKKTEVLLYLKNPSATTIDQICSGRQVLGQVKKLRKIFFIENVKFHIDQLEGFGQFIEIEAIDLDGTLGIEVLRQQCDFYKELLQIADEDLITDSYVDF